MFDRILPRKRPCRNAWEMQPRTARGRFLSYDGSSPGVAAAARAEKRNRRRARARASWVDLEGRIAGGILAHIIPLMVSAPPSVQAALAAWDAPPEAGYR